jgi:DNA-binding GntR family transcriptional regulator
MAFHIEKDTITEKVRRLLRHQIITGHLKPGDHIVQFAVAEQLGISRIPVREGIQALAAEGLVTIAPHHGAVVSPISVEHAAEIFEVRALLEERLLRLAVASASFNDGTLKDAHAYLLIMKKARNKKFDMEQWGSAHWEFHRTLYEPSKQQHTLTMLRSLFLHSERYIALEISNPDFAAQDFQDHQAILMHLQDKNLEAAIALLKHHMLKTPKTMGEADTTPSQSM